MSSRVDLRSLLAGAAAGGLVAGLATFALAYTIKKRQAEKPAAYVLVVRLKLKDVDKFLKIWSPLVEHCLKNEPGCLSYEACRSETSPDEVLIYERYRSKADLTDVHQKSEAYQAFGKAMTEADIVISKSAETFTETKVGYMVRDPTVA